MSFICSCRTKISPPLYHLRLYRVGCVVWPQGFPVPSHSNINFRIHTLTLSCIPFRFITTFTQHIVPADMRLEFERKRAVLKLSKISQIQVTEPLPTAALSVFGLGNQERSYYKPRRRERDADLSSRVCSVNSFFASQTLHNRKKIEKKIRRSKRQRNFCLLLFAS